MGFCTTLKKRYERNPQMEGFAEFYDMLAPTVVMHEWSEAENDRLLEAFKLFGKDNEKIAKHIGTKTKSQT